MKKYSCKDIKKCERSKKDNKQVVIVNGGGGVTPRNYYLPIPGPPGPQGIPGDRGPPGRDGGRGQRGPASITPVLFSSNNTAPPLFLNISDQSSITQPVAVGFGGSSLILQSTTVDFTDSFTLGIGNANTAWIQPVQSTLREMHANSSSTFNNITLGEDVDVNFIMQLYQCVDPTAIPNEYQSVSGATLTITKTISGGVTIDPLVFLGSTGDLDIVLEKGRKYLMLYYFVFEAPGLIELELLLASDFSGGMGVEYTPPP